MWNRSSDSKRMVTVLGWAITGLVAGALVVARLLRPDRREPASSRTAPAVTPVGAAAVAAQRAPAQAGIPDPAAAAGEPIGPTLGEAEGAPPRAEDEAFTRPDEAPPSPERRRFLTLLGIGIGGAGAVIVGIPFVGFLVGPLLKREPDVWRAVGDVAGFKVGTTTEVRFPNASPELWAGVAGQSAAWLRRQSEDAFIAFSINCTHLGCPVRWLAEADLFMCPCHGGVYYNDGTVAAGPPPSPLVRYPVRVRDGTVEVRTSALPIVG